MSKVLSRKSGKKGTVYASQLQESIPVIRKLERRSVQLTGAVCSATIVQLTTSRLATVLSIVHQFQESLPVIRSLEGRYVQLTGLDCSVTIVLRTTTRLATVTNSAMHKRTDMIVLRKE